MAALTGFITSEMVFRHAHMACGIGGGAKGFNWARKIIANIQGRFECAGGIDVDAAGIEEFERATGVRGTVLDLFDQAQYFEHHGKMPPSGWREATPDDVRRAYGPNIDVLFASMPCKGFSGLLSTKKSETSKYQALNGLTLRGIWLALEAYKDDPISVILFENVPRIRTRGRWLLNQIIALLRSYGYLVDERDHNCGELGNLAQSRERFLLIARHPDKVPPFIYQPVKHKLRGVGEVIGKLPLPGDPIAGSMHRVPALQWKTWVRLALVPAGRDWRALNELRVEDGVLTDFGIVPEHPLRDGALGVHRWDDSTGVVIGNQRSPLHGRHSIADIRFNSSREGTGPLAVQTWSGTSNAIAGASRVANGAYSIADIRTGYGPDTHHGVLRVNAWSESTGAVNGRGNVTSGPNAIADVRPNPMMRGGLGVISFSKSIGVIGGETWPTNGAYAVADIRPTQANQTYAQYGVTRWRSSSGAISGQSAPGGGAFSIADIRITGKPRFNNTFRIVPMSSHAPAVAGPGGPAGGLALADPRHGSTSYTTTKYKVTLFSRSSRAVIGASTTGDGAFAVADPRVKWGNGRHENVMRVTPYGNNAGAVPGAVHSVTGGQPCVADERREHYQTCGHYGVVSWRATCGTVSASLAHDNGPGNVADPRQIWLDSDPIILPKPTDRLVCRIISTDETWHRPFTTLELGSLQSWIIPEEVFSFDSATGMWLVNEEYSDFALRGRSDAVNREWIGNMVPPKAAQAMAEEILETLMLARLGETFTLSSKEIWVSPIRAAMAIDQRQVALEWDAEA